MSFDLNSNSPSSNAFAKDTSPIVEQTDFDTPMSTTSTIVHMISDPSPSPSSIRSSKNNRPEDNYTEFPSISIGKKVPLGRISLIHLRRRLYLREFFYARLALVSNMMCFLGILGIVLMVIQNEINFTRVQDKDSKASWFIKLIISITTAILLVLIVYYHHIDMTLYTFRNSLEVWHVELRTKKVLLMIVEILICAIHPVPRYYPRTDPENINLDASESNPYSLSYTAIDVGLGLPMFLRLYLLGRCIMLHSHLVRNVSLRSVGYLNQVSIDFYFLIRTYLEQWPARCLFIFCALAFFIGSWSLRACDYTGTGEHMSMSDAMWLFAETFTTVGYGDLYPSTYCGRSIAAFIGIFGLVLSALLIAIIAEKLVLTREEKYVHTFVLNKRLATKRKNEAANIIKFAIKVWYSKRHGKYTPSQYFQTHRKLSRSIHHHQQIRREQRNLNDQCVGHIELMNIQRKTQVQTEATIKKIVAVKNEITEIKVEMYDMHRSMHTLQKTLNALLDKGTK